MWQIRYRNRTINVASEFLIFFFFTFKLCLCKESTWLFLLLDWEDPKITMLLQGPNQLRFRFKVDLLYSKLFSPNGKRN